MSHLHSHSKTHGTVYDVALPIWYALIMMSQLLWWHKNDHVRYYYVSRGSSRSATNNNNKKGGGEGGSKLLQSRQVTLELVWNWRRLGQHASWQSAGFWFNVWYLHTLRPQDEACCYQIRAARANRGLVLLCIPVCRMTAFHGQRVITTTRQRSQTTTSRHKHSCNTVPNTSVPNHATAVRI